MRTIKILKYLVGYTIPLAAVAGIYLQGAFVFITPLYAFVLLPFIELIIPVNNRNFSALEEEVAKKDRLYDWFLYLHVPLQFAVVFYFLHTIFAAQLAGWEILGMIISVGICCGVIGINVAHELGHRKSKVEQFLAKMLLLTSLYMHFIIEHNKGHHKRVSTLDDPSSARLNEPVYTFYFRTIFGSIKSAVDIQQKELKVSKQSIFSLGNALGWFFVIEILWLVLIASIFSFQTMLIYLPAALIGMLLLESVNYIEHYGLRRELMDSGLYERVQPWHSWNSNHVIGRLVLYELTRHSDHHYLASRKYQVLRHLDTAPQLPAGYPAMIIMALIPPLYFHVMNPLVAKTKQHKINNT